MQEDPVALDSARIVPRASCGEPHPETGVRPAYIKVETPPWLSTTTADPVMDPALCDPPPTPEPGFFRRVWDAKAEIGVAAGVVFVAGVFAGSSPPSGDPAAELPRSGLPRALQ